MRSVFAVTAALMLVFACSDATGPGNPSTWRLEITKNASQAVQAGEGVVGSQVEARLYRSTAQAGVFAWLLPQTVGQGVPGEDVCWDLPNPDIFRIRPICSTTDRDGNIIGEPVTDTLARRLFAVAFANRDGAVQAVDTAWVTVTHGPLAGFWFQQSGSGISERQEVGDTIDLRPMVTEAWDQYRNNIPVDSARSLPDGSVTYDWVDRAISVRTVVASGVGWKAVIPTPRAFTVIDSTFHPGLRLYLNGSESETHNVAVFRVPVP